MQPFLEQFIDRITPEANTGCWLWVGCGSTESYGTIRRNGRTKYAHRVSYESVNGAGSLDGKVARHKCDTPACVNPEHIIPGTNADNMRDAVLRGRFRPKRGEASPNAKLTEQQVLEIRRLVSEGKPTTRVAHLFNVSSQNVHDICTGATWAHLPLAENGPQACRGERNPMTTLNEAKAREIRARSAAGEKQRLIAASFGISIASVKAIVSRRNWSHVL